MYSCTTIHIVMLIAYLMSLKLRAVPGPYQSPDCSTSALCHYFRDVWPVLTQIALIHLFNVSFITGIAGGGLVISRLIPLAI